MNPDDLRLEVATTVDEAALAAVSTLVADATRTDGVAPIDDQVRLDLQYGGGSGTEHWLTGERPDRLVAYAHLAESDDGSATAHVVVAPDARGQGIGREIVGRVLDRCGSGGRLWAHGDLPAARRVAERLRLARVRELLEMRLPGGVALGEPTYPEGVSVRTFETGRDEDSWVAVNAAAFASHPEQGRMTVADLRQRMGQDWFDPAGFFLAERAGELVGFHWTKLEHADDGRLVGEVYVLGVAPGAQGGGLGRALTLTGLRHLRERGAAEIALFVESDNQAALSTYRRIGFIVSRTDVVYARQR